MGLLREQLTTPKEVAFLRKAVAELLIGMKGVLDSHGSLNACFTSHRADAAAEQPHLDAISGFVEALCAASGGRLYHLIPHPARGSACKRLMLYFRWMVRRDSVDPGGWTGLNTADLIVPLDTHVHRMSLRLNLTRRRQPNLATAMEITRGLRAICPADPLRYDFALTRPGIMRVNL